jgi:hypothetical protein
MDSTELTKNLTLQAENKLAEKEKTRLSNDIENLQKSKVEAFKQYDIQIKRKQDEIDSLTEEGKRLQGLNHLAEKSLGDINGKREQAMEKATIEIRDAEGVVKAIHEEARKREVSVKDRELSVEKRGVEATKKEAENKEQLVIINKKAEDNEIESQIIEKSKKEVEGIVATSNTTLANNQKLLEDIGSDIRVKKIELGQLDKEIIAKTEQKEEVGKEADKRLSDVKVREKVVENIEKNQIIKEKELNNREIWIEDREQSLKRSKIRIQSTL